MDAAAVDPMPPPDQSGLPTAADEGEKEDTSKEDGGFGCPFQGAADEGEKEEASKDENPKADESSEALLPSPPADDTKSCCVVGCITESNQCVGDRHESLPTTDIDDPWDHFPSRNSRDIFEPRDHREREYGYPFYGGRYHRNGFPYDYDDPRARYYRNDDFTFHHGDRRGQRNFGYPFCDFRNGYDPMDSLETECMSLCCTLQEFYEKKSYPVGASLSNPSRWICFLNCILQCMVHTVPLVLKLLKNDHPDPCPRASDGFCCYCSLKLHANEIIMLSGNVLYPKKFVKLLELISPDFERGVHQDAHEFLRCLLDKLDEASVAPRSPSEKPSSTESSIVKEIFGGCLKSQLHCPECNHCSDTLEPFLDLNLEVSQMDTVMDALHSFTKVEVIEEFMCDGCKSRVNMEKHLKVERAPEVLVIQLKRFQNVGDFISKIETMVEYQLELDLNPFMSSPDNKPQKYDLYGVVEHLGVPSRGHYVCFIRPSQADWYLFNDDKVCKLASEVDVLDNKAYLLFYMKQGSSPWFFTLLKSDLSDSDESTSSRELDIIDHWCGGRTEKNEIGSSLPDLGPSGETKEPICLPGSSDKIGCVGGLTLLLENKENVPQVSQHTKESSQPDGAGTQGGSPQKNGNSGSLLQSHLHQDQIRGSSVSQAGVCVRKRICTSLLKTKTVGYNSNYECGDPNNRNNNIIKGKCKQL